MTPKLFNELGLSPELLRAIDRLGFEQASPIQAEAIPVLMGGQDVVGQSQTGSGKTAAFAIPAIEKTDPQVRAVQVLILCPTRELAVQVSEEIHKLALFKRGIQALPIYGGQSYERQFYGLKQGAQIVIGTPGRVMDHMRRGTLKLDRVRMMVLDEADVMLDMGFREDIEFILQALPVERQTVFFSATMPKPIRDLIERFSKEPKSVRIEQKSMTVPTVEQVYYEVDRRFKIELLTRLIDIHDLRLGIVFCNTKRMVDELVDHLEAQGYSADRLHGDMSQGMRDRVMGKFRKSGLEFLVATDVAARGIDVDDVQVVFNYDLPYDPEDYVHRIGRTGRAGRSGRAISFVAGREIFQIRNIERFTNTRIHRGRIPTAGEVGAARDNALVERIRSVLISGEYKKQDHLIERLLEEGHLSTDIASVLLHLLGGGEGEAQAAPTRPRPIREPASASIQTGSNTVAIVPSPDRPPAPEAAAPTIKVLPKGEAGIDPGLAARTKLDKPVESARTLAPRAELPRKPAVPSLVPPIADESERPRGAGREMVENPQTPSENIVPPASPASDRTEPRVKKGGPRHRDIPEWARKKMGIRYVDKRQPRERSGEVGEGSRPDSIPSPRKDMVRTSLPVRGDHFKPAPGDSVRKASRKTPPHQTRLWLNVGDEMGVGPSDVVGAILGETGLPAGTVGYVDLRERHLFVDVATEHLQTILSALKRTKIKRLSIKAKTA